MFAGAGVTLADVLAQGEWAPGPSYHFGGGINVLYQHVLTFNGASVKVLYKDCGDGRTSRREAQRDALVAKAAEISGLVCVPQGVYRRGPVWQGKKWERYDYNTGKYVACRGRGFDGTFTWVQELIEDNGGSPYFERVEKDAIDMALFDIIIGNTDRHSGNLLTVREGSLPRRLVAIDHGFAFREEEAEISSYVSSAFGHEMRRKYGRFVPLSDESLARVRALLDRWEELDALRRKVGYGRIGLSRAKRRAEHMLSFGKLPTSWDSFYATKGRDSKKYTGNIVC